MKQPEALKLADELVEVHNGHTDEGPTTFSEAAAELRRLHEVNQELLAACVKTVEENGHLADGDVCTLIHLVKAIQKATGGQS